MQSFPVVVTSISAPNTALRRLASGAQATGGRFIVVGDGKSPADFQLEGCEFYSLEQQAKSGLRFAALCPQAKYSRKNIGYLLAIREGCDYLVETDDDNLPRADFWHPRQREVSGRLVTHSGWVNAYRFFSSAPIYPRGFPLEAVDPERRAAVTVEKETTVPCPIQQGLADTNPDVDAVYRMLLPLPIDFDQRAPLILNTRTWCPFNSQNTTFFREVFPLLYLPTYCSFRMTDIWRSFVAQRILWTCGWMLSFHSATVYQERNEHNLLRDFADEIPGYLNNHRIARTLDELDLAPGVENVASNMVRCYEALISLELIGAEERKLLSAWHEDLREIGHNRS